MIVLIVVVLDVIDPVLVAMLLVLAVTLLEVAMVPSVVTISLIPPVMVVDVVERPPLPSNVFIFAIPVALVETLFSTVGIVVVLMVLINAVFAFSFVIARAVSAERSVGIPETVLLSVV